MEAPHSDPGTRPSLLVRVRDPQDAESWETFVNIYGPLVYRYCRVRGLQDADASDVCQEVLTRIVRSIRTFVYQPERGRFRDWMGRVARNEIARFQRRQGRAPRGTGSDEAADMLDETTGEADGEWTAQFNAQVLSVSLERIRPQFEPATWRAFERVWHDQQPALETARELGMPIDSVYAAKSRVLKRLREEILMLAEDVPQFVPLH
jgi:RNA polymerase sigma-70 factor (ECF subfamily)